MNIYSLTFTIATLIASFAQADFNPQLNCGIMGQGWQHRHGCQQIYVREARHFHEDGSCAELSFEGDFAGPRLVVADKTEIASLEHVQFQDDAGNFVVANDEHRVQAVWVHQGCHLTAYQYENYGIFYGTGKAVGATFSYEGSRIVDQWHGDQDRCEAGLGSAPGAEYDGNVVPANVISSLKCSCDTK